MKKSDIKKGSLVNVQFTGKVFKIRRDSNGQRLIGVSTYPDRYIVWCDPEHLEKAEVVGPTISEWAEDYDRSFD